MTTITLIVAGTLWCNQITCTSNEEIIQQQTGDVITYTINPAIL